MRVDRSFYRRIKQLIASEKEVQNVSNLAIHSYGEQIYIGAAPDFGARAASGHAGECSGYGGDMTGTAQDVVYCSERKKTERI